MAEVQFESQMDKTVLANFMNMKCFVLLENIKEGKNTLVDRLVKDGYIKINN